MIQYYWLLLGSVLISAFICLIPLFFMTRKPKYDTNHYSDVILETLKTLKKELDLKLAYLEKQTEFIQENNTINASNINDFFIGQLVVDSKGFVDVITNKTSNTIEVEVNKRTKKGVNHKQWFTMASFNKNYKAK